MYLDRIQTFLPNYSNMNQGDFITMIQGLGKRPGLAYKYEKDFILTLILIRFSEIFPDLVFKGWTCLNKVYFPYFRLSEDLDFVLENNDNIGRTARKILLKQYENIIIAELEKLGITLQDERTKFDEYRLAMFSFEYESALDGSIQTIKIDISLKGQLQLPPKILPIRAIFRDVVLAEDIFSEHSLTCIDLTEALSEKMRAALTRREPAIRDFFDIWYAREVGGFDFTDAVFLRLLEEKLREVGYEYTLEGNRKFLEKQIITDLRPVLTDDFGFDFDSIYTFILSYKI